MQKLNDVDFPTVPETLLSKIFQVFDMTIFHLLYPKSIHGRLKREKTVKENRY
jgi:hypothetical protein